MISFFWRVLASILAQPVVVDWLIKRAILTPYTHIDGCMERYWLFNPYPSSEVERENRPWWRKLLPSIRLHKILRRDLDRDPHDHPWQARTIILRGGYVEERLVEVDLGVDHYKTFNRRSGDTATLTFGEYHRITMVTVGGVWTLFITWRKQDSWGFLVNGAKVPWRDYLGVEEES